MTHSQEVNLDPPCQDINNFTSTRINMTKKCKWLKRKRGCGKWNDSSEPYIHRYSLTFCDSHRIARGRLEGLMLCALDVGLQRAIQPSIMRPHCFDIGEAFRSKRLLSHHGNDQKQWKTLGGALPWSKDPVLCHDPCTRVPQTVLYAQW